MNNFAPKEIEAAKAVKEQIINGDISELKSVYMAGEICMWDELQQAWKGQPESDAIECLNWVIENKSISRGDYTDGSFIWWSDTDGKSFTSDRLYQQFLESKNK